MSVHAVASRPEALPHPPWRIPLLGDVVGQTLGTPIQDAMRSARTLGPVFERKILNKRFVFTGDPDIVAELSDETRFAKQLIPQHLALQGISGDGLATAFNDDPNWYRAHNLLRPAFTQAAMRRYHRAMLETAGDLVRHWDRQAGRGSIDVPGDMTKLALETIGRTGFSFHFDPFDRDTPHPLATAIVESLRYAQIRAFITIPVLGDRIMRRMDEKEKQRRSYQVSVVDEVIAARREHGHTGEDDLLELMMRAERENDPNSIDERNIRYQIITFLVAGHETTSGSMSFALHYLAQHPQIADRARAEVDEVWGRAEEPQYEQIAKLRFLRRVVDESMRLWPTGSAFARGPREETMVARKYRMSPADAIIVLIPTLHRAPLWGTDPEAFDPDRFLSERVRSRPPHTFKPFGTGERACIGRQFALHEILLVLGTILRRYDLRPEPGYRLQVSERLTLMPDKLRLHLRPRD